MSSISMTKRQVAELLKFLNDVYPFFEVTQSRIDSWSILLKNQNPAEVMRRAERYSLENKYPPKVADLAVKKIESRKSDFLELAKEWERKAVDKPRS